MDFRNDKQKLSELVSLMNEQSETPTMVTDDLLYVIDVAIEPEEVDFLLKMGGGNVKRDHIEARVGLPRADCDRLLATLLSKGQITELPPGPGEDQPNLHLMSLLPGWFELFLMGGSETPDRQEFSKRLSGFFRAAREIPSEVLNTVMRDTAPHRSIAAANPPEPRLIAVGEGLQPPVSQVYPTHSILNVLEQLGENDAVAVGHCFCRQQRKMDGDPCRMNLPEEACIAVGSGAEHLMKHGLARRISKAEAVDLIKDAEQNGAIHQVGRVVPLKDFETKHEVDIICNCCWDCCGVLGNYSRGNTPFLLKSFYIAEIAGEEACTACGICEEYCPVCAITLGEDGVARIRPELCCGCGLCVFHCPDEAIQLRPSERDVFLPVLGEAERRIS
jgi:ferredoxin